MTGDDILEGLVGDPVTGIPCHEQARCAVCGRPLAEHGRYRATCLPGFGTYSRNSKFTPLT